jgi:hypothetical protein
VIVPQLGVLAKSKEDAKSQQYSRLLCKHIDVWSLSVLDASHLLRSRASTPCTFAEIGLAALPSNLVLEAPILIGEGEAQETTLPNSLRKRKPSTEPDDYAPRMCSQPSDIPTSHHRRSRAHCLTPHLGSYTHNYNNRTSIRRRASHAVQTLDCSKRRRRRARGVESSTFNVSYATTTIDRNAVSFTGGGGIAAAAASETA